MCHKFARSFALLAAGTDRQDGPNDAAGNILALLFKSCTVFLGAAFNDSIVSLSHDRITRLMSTGEEALRRAASYDFWHDN